MAGPVEQLVKTPPAFPSASRRSFAGSQGRHSMSAKSYREPSLDEFGGEMGFSEFIANGIIDPSLASMDGYAAPNHEAFAQTTLESDFSTDDTQGQFQVGIDLIDPRLRGNAGPLLQLETRKASQHMVDHPLTALPSIEPVGFMSYPEDVISTQYAYAPEEVQQIPQDYVDPLYINQRPYVAYPPMEYQNHPYYPTQANFFWNEPQEVQPAGPYTADFTSSFATAGQDPHFAYTDPAYVGYVDNFGPVSQVDRQSASGNFPLPSLAPQVSQPPVSGRPGLPSPASRPSTRSNNTSYSGRRGRIGSSTDESEHEELAPTRKARQRKSVVQYYAPEKPKAPDDKSWVRTNTTTKGLTTRTGKINNYKNPYEACTPPKDWHYYTLNKKGKRTKVEVKYTKHGEIAKDKLSAREIKNFIFRYRENEEKPDNKLKLWIQKCPTDSARRYLNKGHSKCRLADCPAVVYQTGTILHGHYRVAFDEMWLTHGTNSDPYLATMYVHLYCMERFLDFQSICELRNIVEVDGRELLQEPKGRWAASLYSQPESTIARDFVKFCRGEISDVDEFENYPIHSQFKRGDEKPHKHTLTYLMHETKEATRPQAQLNQFMVDRALKRSHILVHKGNLEVMFEDVKTRKKVKNARNKKRVEDDDSHDEDESGEEEDPLVAGVLKKLATTRPRARQGRKPTKHTKQRPVRQASEEESDTEEFSNPNGDDSEVEEIIRISAPPQGSRTSARIAKQVEAQGPTNYAVDTDVAAPQVETSRKRKIADEDSDDFETTHEAKRTKIISYETTNHNVSNQRSFKRPSSYLRESPLQSPLGGAIQRPRLPTASSVSSGRLSIDSHGFPRLPDLGWPSPAGTQGQVGSPSCSGSLGLGLQNVDDIDLGDDRSLFEELQRRRSSTIDSARPRSRGMSLLRSLGTPRSFRGSSVTFSEQNSTREFRSNDPPRKQELRRSSRATQTAHPSSKPAGVQKQYGDRRGSTKR